MALLRDLSEAFLQRQPQSAARALESMKPAETASLLAEVRPAVAAIVFRRLVPHFAASVLEQIKPERSAQIVSGLPADIAVRTLRLMEDGSRERLLNALPSRIAQNQRSLLRFPEGTAADYMDPDIVTLTNDLTAEKALQRLRKSAHQVITNLYVLDRSNVLVGVLNLQELLTARPQEVLAGIMHEPVHRLAAAARLPVILAHPGWLSVPCLPVVDEGGILLGALRYRRLKRIEEEARATAPDPGLETSKALGELIVAGMGGLLESMVTPASRSQ